MDRLDTMHCIWKNSAMSDRCKKMGVMLVQSLSRGGTGTRNLQKNGFKAS